jgi:membrane protein implicated in regulation of membrane protease activity
MRSVFEFELVVCMAEQRRGFWAWLGSLFASKEQGYELEDEDIDAYESIVTVIQDVSPDSDTGRIEFRGTSWKATSISAVIPAGDEARIVYRENLVWFVERLEKSAFSELEEQDN